MDVSIIETSGLGDRSYLVTHHGIAVVVDPQRDIDRVLTLAEKARVRITHVLETHLHNDYVTGGLELSRSVGADYAVPAGDDVDYDRRAVADGDVIDAGPIQLEVLHTPGHTHHHVSYVLREVRTYMPDAWIDRATLDEQDGGIGKVGYEINFNRHFYRYTPPRSLEEIDAELKQAEEEIMRLLREVTT